MNRPATAPAYSACWAHDLVLEVPGEHQHVVGLLVEQRRRVRDRLVGAGHVQALLVHVAVDHEVDEVGADAHVVEQRGALGGRAVGGDRGARRPSADRSRSSRSARELLDPLAEVGVVVEACRCPSGAPRRGRPSAGVGAVRSWLPMCQRSVPPCRSGKYSTWLS